MKPCIIFDLDGTLLDSLQDLCNAVNHTLAQFGYPLRTLEEVRTFVGTGAKNLIRKALPGKENDPPLEQVLADYQVYYNAHSQVKTRPYDGILEALTEIRKEFPIAVVSNKPDIATKPLCREYFGEDIFAMGESAVCPRKPAPDMLHQAMKAIGVERCVYVGDSEVDVLTAKNAEVPCVCVLWGFRDREDMEAVGGDIYCEHTEDLVNIIEETIHGQ